jgi:F-type H+-transporting ATPase subunit delta
VSSDVIGASGLAGRYATALFELADADKQLDQVAEDLATIELMLEGSEDLTRLIRSPVVSREDQSKGMAAVLDSAETGALTKNFVGVVSSNRRLFALPGMIKGYQALLADRRGETTAEIVSAKKLSEAQITALGESLKKAMGTNVAIDAEVDEELLGGLIVKVGSRMVDSSLRTKLSQLRFAMKGTG